AGGVTVRGTQCVEWRNNLAACLPMLTLNGECWVITDASAGNQRQALALAEQLQMPSRHLLLEPRPPWSWLAPRLTLGGQLALPASQRAWFAPPWPAVAIGCGRAAALFTRMLRPLSRALPYRADPRSAPQPRDVGHRNCAATRRPRRRQRAANARIAESGGE